MIPVSRSLVEDTDLFVTKSGDIHSNVQVVNHNDVYNTTETVSKLLHGDEITHYGDEDLDNNLASWKILIICLSCIAFVICIGKKWRVQYCYVMDTHRSFSMGGILQHPLFEPSGLNIVELMSTVDVN